MDIQAMASQLVGFLGDNPDLITQFVEHPYSTTAKVTDTDEEISKQDMSQIVTQVAAQSTGQSFGMGEISNIASALLGQNGGSVHALTGALFSGKSSDDLAAMAEDAFKSAVGGMMTQGAASMLMGAFGGKKQK